MNATIEQKLPPFHFEGLVSTLSAGNRAFEGALKRALSAIHHLDDAGCTVTDIDIRGGMPVLRIDRPPSFVTGAAMVRSGMGIHRKTIRVARFHDTQIEWVERDPHEAPRRPLTRRYRGWL